MAKTAHEKITSTQDLVHYYPVLSPVENHGNGNGYAKVDLLKYEADDNGNALTMRDLYGEMFLYSPALGWLQYTGTHHEQVSDKTVKFYASETLRLRRHAAIDAKNETLVKAAKQSSYNIHGCIEMFSVYVLSKDINEFDSDPDLLNCLNGVVNLRTGSVTPHLPCQRFTYCVPVEYKPDADMSLWNTFIHDVIGNESIVHYLQKCVGYSLTGHTREEKLFYFHGPQRAGKGTFTETMLTLLPKPMGTEVDFNSFTARRDADSQNFDLASLKTTRFLVASESNRFQSLNPAKVKQITGGNWIRCAFKHKDMFEYRPQFKVWLTSNHPVNADADDDALWGRVQVFNFPHSYIGQEDTTLKTHLKSPENLEGVLRWAIDGAMLWYKDVRLTPPQAIIDATQQQRDSQDYIKLWLADCCALENEQDFTPSVALMTSYQAWCKESNVKAERVQDFSGSLTRRFHCIPCKKDRNTRGYKGIRLTFLET